MRKCLTSLAFVLLMAATQALAQTAPTEVVVKGALRPKLAEEAVPPPLEVYTQIPRIELIALSDGGGQFAFVTHKGGLRLLTTYNVTDGSNKTIRLSEDPLTALTWLDNDRILLSGTLTGVRGTCPSRPEQLFKAARAMSDLRAAVSVVGSKSDSASEDPILALITPSSLPPPQCADYGVRSHDAATIVDLRTSQSISLGSKMDGNYYDHMPLGLPKPVRIDGKMQLVGSFLELRDRSIGGQLAQRVYLWRVDPDTGRARIIDDHGGDLDRMGSYVDDWLTDETGQPIARTLYTYLDETFSIEMKTSGKWTPIFRRKIDAKTHTFAPYLAGLGRDGQSLLIIDVAMNNNGGRRFHYYELSTDGKLSAPLDEDATRDRPIFNPDTGALAGFEHSGEITTYNFYDPDLAEVYKYAVDTAPGQAVRIAAMARDPRQMIVFAQGGDDTGSWHYYDFSKGNRVDIGQQYPSVPAQWVAPQKPITYKASDGQDIPALLTLPPKGEPKNRALVVMPHDGPLDHDTRSFDWLAQALASRGYVVLQPNYRGSDGYSQALTEAGYGQWSGRILDDISDGVKYLAAQGIVDSKRVCIAGQGYGGYAALSGAQNKASYRCAVSINGIADPDDYVKDQAKSAIADDAAPIKADPAQSRNFIADAHSPSLIKRYFGSQPPSSITAASITIPVLIVNSQWDKTVSPSQSRSLRDALQKTGKPATYVELPDCGHYLTGDACRLTTAQAVIDFLKVNNPAK